MSATVDELGVMDSGANISITNPDVVVKFNLQPQRWDQPFHIKFGNGSRFFCTHFAYFGPILGRVAIVDAAPDTLVSIAVLTARGFEVRFLENGQGVGIFKDRELLYHGPQHPETRLWHIDIQSLINPPDTLITLPDHTDADVAYKDPSHHVGHKATLDQSMIRDVLWLHKRMGHPSRATMYQSIFNGTWTELPSHIKPADINKVLKTLHCTACAMCKRNKLPQQTGDGQHAPLPGNVLSVDYQGKINPLSVRGYSGFYLFKDSCTGMRHAEMVKDKTATSFQKALNNVIQFYNSHGHTVLKIRCDAGSTENDAGIVFCGPQSMVSPSTQQPSESKIKTQSRERSNLSSKEWDAYFSIRIHLVPSGGVMRFNRGYRQPTADPTATQQSKIQPLPSN